MPGPKPLDPTAGPAALLGSELRKHRSERGWTQAQLAEAIRFSASLVGLIERAAQNPTRDFVERCEQALGLQGDLLRLWAAISKENAPKWFRPWLDVEQGAHRLRTWEPLIVPGLLQTEQYARVMLSNEPGVSQEQVEESVTARLDRQKIFLRNPPPMFLAVLDEGILHRPIGDREAMYGQLQHLINMAASPCVTIQVVPYRSQSTPGLLGGFVIAQTDNVPDTVYLESAGHGQLRDDPATIAGVSVRYDSIRAGALPQRESIELIRETMEKQWS
ncbi:helix-turn-helix transcriptional regulator [Acrocarpospora macrocephala]|uniref:Transcriptional regulator n=1 Tax=Acrocarpospora macrocephala TaxID=150177 RepID=A0A5M3WLM4_9ACTN|nr:helix-turn-helix transcriptional regulator [Acrocarpospora macrocephala]GES07803.1 transcriptional regulator [Acrocarpospora macrocephala]